jgi:hypothetical protein
MSVISIDDPEAALSYLKELVLPAPPPRVPSRGGESPAAAEAVTGSSRALAVGSQFTEFASDVPPDLRSELVSTFLVAQLAANAHVENIKGTPKDWYDRYCMVLATTGWDVNVPVETVVDVSGSRREVYHELVPILGAALGAVAASSTLMALFKGLGTLARDLRWIELVNRASRQASANLFQVGYVEIPAGGKPPRTTLTWFDLQAEQVVTQVLFFRSTGARATLKHRTVTMNLNEPVFQRVKGLVAERIQEHLDACIAAVEL